VPIRNGRVYASCASGIRVIENGRQGADHGRERTANGTYLLEALLQRPKCDKAFNSPIQGKWGFVGLDGVAFRSTEFRNAIRFRERICSVKQGQKWGVIDSSGHYVLPAKFDGFKGQREGLFHFAMDGKEVWVTASGEERRSLDQICGAAWMLDWGTASSWSRDGRWGIADAGGGDVIAPLRAIVCFKNGIAWAPVDSRRQWCALGPDGGYGKKNPLHDDALPFVQPTPIRKNSTRIVRKQRALDPRLSGIRGGSGYRVVDSGAHAVSFSINSAEGRSKIGQERCWCRARPGLV